MIDLSWAASFLPLTGAGFGVGFLVGLTGVGGGALMTPLLISSFGVSPQVAIGSDLLNLERSLPGCLSCQDWSFREAASRWLPGAEVQRRYRGLCLDT